MTWARRTYFIIAVLLFVSGLTGFAPANSSGILPPDTKFVNGIAAGMVNLAHEGIIEKTYEYRDGRRSISMSYPVTGVAAIDAKILAFVEETADAFKLGNGGTSLLLRFESFGRGSMLGFKFTLATVSNKVFRTDIRAMQFDTANGNTLLRDDIFAEGHEPGLKNALKDALIKKGYTAAYSDELLATPGGLDNFWLDGDFVYFAFNHGKPRTARLALPALEGLLANYPGEDKNSSESQDNALPDKLVALTFDDGPNLKTTPVLLDILKEHKARATFFVIGQSLSGKEELVSRMALEGHEIGNHSYTHADLARIGKSGLDAEIDQTSAAVLDITGKSPSLLRPPFGRTGVTLESAAGEKGLSVVLWDVDPYDWKRRDAKIVSEHILNQAKDGDIILMHDIYGTSVEAARIVIEELSERGFGFVTVSELYARGNP